LPQAFAQLLQGSIIGNVSDASRLRSPPPGCLATDENTGLTRAVVANSTGVYDIPVLPPGTYKLTINAPGFQTAVRTGVVVAAQTATARRRHAERRCRHGKRGGGRFGDFAPERTAWMCGRNWERNS
jgi:hypothetical protein